MYIGGLIPRNIAELAEAFSDWGIVVRKPVSGNLQPKRILLATATS